MQWTPPPESKDGYKYNVSGSNGQSDITQQTEFIFSKLDAGSNYSFSVQTLTADGTAGAVVNVTGCTGEHWSHSCRMQKNKFSRDNFS